MKCFGNKSGRFWLRLEDGFVDGFRWRVFKGSAGGRGRALYGVRVFVGVRFWFGVVVVKFLFDLNENVEIIGFSIVGK